MLSALRKMETGRLMRIVMCAFSAAFLVGAFAAPDPGSALRGLARICTAPAQLTRDYFLPDYGGVSGTLLNAALVGAVCCALMFLPRASVDAGTVLGFFLTLGFCFYGINVLNILPLMLGVWVYALAKRRAPGELLNQFMFSTAIAPLITQVLFYYPVMGDGPRLTFAGICLAVGIGMITGFCMPALCAHSRLFHKGFDLYNAGPAAGFLCALIYAALYRARGIEAPAISAVLGEGEDAFANAFCAGLFLLCLAFGAILNGGTRGFGQLMGDAGYETDFTRKYGAGLCLMNLGVYGLFILLYYNLIGAAFTGPTTGAVFCMVCCCL
ncbi:MAG: DUF1576 domain-containing protein, partial [Clostridia bacterium]|nr:DUF1576 domain-containing protein [Clostridia bacterium]